MVAVFRIIVGMGQFVCCVVLGDPTQGETFMDVMDFCMDSCLVLSICSESVQCTVSFYIDSIDSLRQSLHLSARFGQIV